MSKVGKYYEENGRDLDQAGEGEQENTYLLPQQTDQSLLSSCISVLILSVLIFS